MSKFLIIIFLLASFSKSNAQDFSEFNVHLESIDSSYYPCKKMDLPDSVFNGARAFADYAIQHLLKNPNDKQFIANRNLLKILKKIDSDSLSTHIRDTLKNGKTLDFSLQLIKTNTFKGLYPSNKIKSLVLKINEKEIIIPDSLLSYFANINTLQSSQRFTRNVELYESLSGDYIYLYFYGGMNGYTYFSKLIFNHDKYITQITADYYALSTHASFTHQFIGF